MKYEYMLQTWGGFYNEEFKQIHGEEKGFTYFDTEQERAEYISYLKKISKDLGAEVLMFSTEEGYHTRVPVVAHRICRYKGREYHTTSNLPPCYGYEAALYWMKYKWYVGFNDYPLGKDFDYCDKDFEVVAEWVTGAFSLKEII